MTQESSGFGKRIFQVIWLRFFVLALGLAHSLAVSTARSQSATKVEDPEPAARVGARAIRQARVEAYLRATVPNWPLDPELQPPLRRAAVEHLVRRELVFLWLEKNGFAPTQAEIDWLVDERRAELARVEKKLDDYLTEKQLTLAELRDEFGWGLAWKKYLDTTLTEEKIAAHFRASPRDYDGTELRVAQILFAVTEDRSRFETVMLAGKIRQQLQRGELTWDAAVREHSIAASRESAGDLGWIRRHEPMPEEFSSVAFQLGEGELAPPLGSTYGVHLIKCLEVRPGKQQLGDVRDSVRRELMESEYLRLAESMRGEVEVSIRLEK